MRETIEFRLDEEDAQRYLRSPLGHTLHGSVRLIRVSPGSAAYEAVAAAEGEWRGLVGYWSLTRRYSRAELESAELVWARPQRMFEPGGEGCGTEYDESTTCPVCGVGRRQVSTLRVDAHRIPRTTDVAFTLGDDFVISARLTTILEREGLTGVRVEPVLDCPGRRVVDRWSQLVVSSAPVALVEPTRFGINPFHDDATGQYRCPFGHVAGLNMLSEPYLLRSDWDSSDVVQARQRIGRRAGLLVPLPLLFISQRAYRVFVAEGVGGLRYEVAHLV
jgi:hypothetical protein